MRTAILVVAPEATTPSAAPNAAPVAILDRTPVVRKIVSPISTLEPPEPFSPLTSNSYTPSQSHTAFPSESRLTRATPAMGLATGPTATGIPDSVPDGTGSLSGAPLLYLRFLAMLPYRPLAAIFAASSDMPPASNDS